MTIEGVQQ